MKISFSIKLGVLKPNPRSEILHKEIFQKFQNEAVSWKGVLDYWIEIKVVWESEISCENTWCHQELCPICVAVDEGLYVLLSIS